MEKMNIIKVVLALVLVSFFVFCFFKFFAWRDSQVERGAEKWENCILEEYKISPAQYYAEHGEYPICFDSNY